MTAKRHHADNMLFLLSTLSRTDMQNLLLELQKELHKTIIFITHDLMALKLRPFSDLAYGATSTWRAAIDFTRANDPYIEDFVSDINRARVLRVKSVMTKLLQTKVGMFMPMTV